MILAEAAFFNGRLTRDSLDKRHACVMVWCGSSQSGTMRVHAGRRPASLLPERLPPRTSDDRPPPAAFPQAGRLGSARRQRSGWRPVGQVRV